MPDLAILWVWVTALISASAILWLQYFDLKDSLRPEPRGRQFLAFGLGALAALGALGAFLGLGAAGLPRAPGDSPGSVAFFCFVLVGPIEEGAKFLAMRLGVWRWDVFDEETDGLVYASAIGLGFASLENMLYLPSMPPAEGALRSLVSPLTHAVFASPWGFALARARVAERAADAAAGRTLRWGFVAGALLLSMLAHGLYDYLLLAKGALPQAAVVVAVLWIALIVRARRALRRDARRALGGRPVPPATAKFPATDTPPAGSGTMTRSGPRAGTDRGRSEPL